MKDDSVLLGVLHSSNCCTHSGLGVSHQSTLAHTRKQSESVPNSTHRYSVPGIEYGTSGSWISYQSLRRLKLERGQLVSVIPVKADKFRLNMPLNLWMADQWFVHSSRQRESIRTTRLRRFGDGHDPEGNCKEAQQWKHRLYCGSAYVMQEHPSPDSYHWIPPHVNSRFTVAPMQSVSPGLE